MVRPLPRARRPCSRRPSATREGKVALAKLDTDANPGSPGRSASRASPPSRRSATAQVVAEFVGAQPRPQVERFLDALLPSEADALVAAGDEASLRRALELEPGRADAAVALARLLADRGERDEALAVLSNVAGSFAADGLAARLRLEGDDPAIGDAFAALDAGQLERGLDALIGAIAAAEDGRRDDLRKAVVGVLDELGVEHPVAREARRKLASALY